jgi:hypothetical protein
VAGDGEMSEAHDRCGPVIGAAYRVDRIGELGVHALTPQASVVLS